MADLRPYQADAVASLRDSVARGARAPLLVLPTGAGKTVVAAHLIRSAREKNKRVLFLAPRRELVHQTCEKLAQVDVVHGVMMAGERRSFIPDVQVACIPTLHRRAIVDERIELPRADLVLVDEAHLSIAKTTRSIVDHYANQGATVIGLTATPCRSDGAGLGTVYDHLLEGMTVRALTDQGFLVPARYFVGSTADLTGVQVQAGDYNQKQLGERVNDVTLIGDVVENWSRLASGRQTFVFSVNISHSMNLCRQFQELGIAAEHLDGHTPNDERAAILSRLRSGETQVLTNCDVMTYGMDFPPVSCIVLAKPTKSIARYFQMLGRGLRPFPGKEDCLILDHAGSVEQIGFYDDAMPWSLDGTEKIQDRLNGTERSEPEPITCGDCGASFRPARACPRCGAEQGGRYERAIEAHEADLREIDRQRRIADPEQWNSDDRRRFYGELKAIALERGYKPGWAAHKFKAKLGTWPSGLDHIPPVEPSVRTRAWVKSQQIRYAKSKDRRAAA